ncbi:response regulator [Pseudomonas protegens]|uniref:response regulator n=1 Tax=Pseudomonas protegens TaxID=380021 RepID=UPI00227E0890|nr:response regulator [Pseudomonas protegens]MCY7261888.1 response regulator [Pseudomonas protegens]
MMNSILRAGALVVLVVDDHPASRFLLSKQLGHLGHKVIVSEDGMSALIAWRANHVDVVITDCNLPVMDGYTLAGTIRSEERRLSKKKCLILGVTANAQLYENDRCFEAGMDGCFFKPVSLRDLARRLERERTLAMVAHLAESKPVNSADIDLSSLEFVTRNDEAAMNRLLEDLITSNQDDLARLGTLSVKLDAERITDLAHRVKGGARIIKAHSLIMACEHVEAMFKSENSTPILEKCVCDLKREMTALALTLRRRSGPGDRF